MKNKLLVFKRFLYTVLLAPFFVGCSFGDLEEPEACFTIRDEFGVTLEEPIVIETKQNIVAAVSTTADYMAFYSGEDNHVWGTYPDVEQTGKKSISGEFSLSYKVAGTYELTYVATNRTSRDEYKQATVSCTITVVDSEEE